MYVCLVPSSLPSLSLSCSSISLPLPPSLPLLPSPLSLSLLPPFSYPSSLASLPFSLFRACLPPSFLSCFYPAFFPIVPSPPPPGILHPMIFKALPSRLLPVFVLLSCLYPVCLPLFLRSFLTFFLFTFPSPSIPVLPRPLIVSSFLRLSYLPSPSPCASFFFFLPHIPFPSFIPSTTC